MAKLETYGAGYGGLLSNSMLQAAIVCPVKYDLMYRKGINPEKDGLYFNSAFIGNVIHKVLELHDDDHKAAESEYWAILGEYFGETFTGRTRALLGHYSEARRRTNEYGIQQRGTAYSAPEMTGYWKKNFAGITTLLEKLDAEATGIIEGSVFEEPYIELIKRGLICLENWKGMRIDASVANEILLSGTVGPDDAAIAMVGTADRLEKRPYGRVALCDFKTGRWTYDTAKTQNSDQFGLYHRLLEQTDHGAPVEWVIYNLFTGQTVRVVPTAGLLEKFDNRLANNLRYFKQLEQMFDKVEVPTPAGAAFKTGCPCILSQTGDCPFYFTEEKTA